MGGGFRSWVASLQGVAPFIGSPTSNLMVASTGEGVSPTQHNGLPTVSFSAAESGLGLVPYHSLRFLSRLFLLTSPKKREVTYSLAHLGKNSKRILHRRIQGEDRWEGRASPRRDSCEKIVVALGATVVYV